MLLVSAMILPAHATLPSVAFWVPHLSKLKFTTSAQSIYRSNCSGVATLQTLNFQGAATNVSSDLTVNLTGANLTFYSDSNCTSTVTSITVKSGTNSTNFYFVASVTGSLPVTASAASYTNASQTETISTNPFVWAGGGGDANWSTAANWSGGAAPGAANIAVFDSTCVSNCSPSIAASINVGGVRINSSYAGTITQNSGVTITLGSSGWIQAAGTFVGSSGGDAITVSGPWALTGGSYTSTSGTLQVNGSFYKVSGSPTFSHNGGLLQFNQAWGSSPSITPGSVTYKNVKFSGDQSSYNLNGGTMTIAGDLTISNPFSTQGYGSLSSGTILVSGNLNLLNNGYEQGSGLTVKLVGNAAGQTVTGVANSILRGDLIIDTGTNPVTFSGTVSLYNSNFTVASVGTFTSTGSTFNFNPGSGTTTITGGSATLNNLSITLGADGCVVNISGTLNVAGKLTLDGQNYINGGTINAYGDIATGTYSYSGSATIVAAGNAAGQTISGTTAAAKFPNVTIAAGSNTVTLSGSVSMGRNFTYTSGNLVATGSTLFVSSDCTAPTITPGSAVYNNVQFIGTNCTFLNETLSGTFNIAGNLTLSSLHLINGGALAVAGNTSITSGYGGTASITFSGSSAQTVTQTGGSFPSGAVTVNNASGITLGSDVTWNGSSQTTAVTSGSISMAGHNLTLHALNLNGNTLTKGGGVLTVATGASPYGGTVNP